MRRVSHSRGRGLAGRRRGLKGLAKDESGTTAIEFGLVGVPFMMLCFGVITMGLYALTMHSLENGVERASRLIRTGQAQSSHMTEQQFKQKICENAANYIDCGAKMQVHIQSWADGQVMNPISCLQNGVLSGGQSSAADLGNSSGGASRTVLVTVCYEWELAAILPFLKIGKMANGSALMQAASAFRTEPYQ